MKISEATFIMSDRHHSAIVRYEALTDQEAKELHKSTNLRRPPKFRVRLRIKGVAEDITYLSTSQPNLTRISALIFLAVREQTTKDKPYPQADTHPNLSV
jgi:hypothetical protein